MFLCIKDIMLVTPTEEMAHMAVINDGQALNGVEIQIPNALMSSIVN